MPALPKLSAGQLLQLKQKMQQADSSHTHSTWGGLDFNMVLMWHARQQVQCYAILSKEPANTEYQLFDSGITVGLCSVAAHNNRSTFVAAVNASPAVDFRDSCAVVVKHSQQELQLRQQACRACYAKPQPRQYRRSTVCCSGSSTMCCCGVALKLWCGMTCQELAALLNSLPATHNAYGTARRRQTADPGHVQRVIPVQRKQR